MSIVRAESRAELLRSLDPPEPRLREYDRHAIRRIRKARMAGRPVVLNEVGALTLWSHDGEEWECLCACSDYAEVERYLRRAALEDAPQEPEEEG